MWSGHFAGHTSGQPFLYLSQHCSFLPGYHRITFRLAIMHILNLKRLTWPWAKCIAITWMKRSSFLMKMVFPHVCPGEGNYFKRDIMQKMLLFSSLCTKGIPYFALHRLLLLLSCCGHVRLCATPSTAAHQAPPSLEFSRQEYWSGLPFHPPMHAYMLSRFGRVRLCATPWTTALQVPLSTGFSKQEYWSGFPFPSPFHFT